MIRRMMRGNIIAFVVVTALLGCAAAQPPVTPPLVQQASWPVLFVEQASWPVSRWTTPQTAIPPPAPPAALQTAVPWSPSQTAAQSTAPQKPVPSAAPPAASQTAAQPAGPQTAVPQKAAPAAPPATAAPPPAQPAAAAPAPPPGPPLKPGYAGTETCKMCHEEIFNRFSKSPHYALDSNASRGWAAQSCESCHGPGAKHAESADAKDIRQPAKLSPVDADRVCLACHLNNTTHFGRIMTGHAKETVGCPECHSVHGAGGRKLVIRKSADINAQCAACHMSVWASFQKPYKHRLPEGAMSCTNCHNPHASFRPQNMSVAFGNEPTCFQCHSDKRGPFVFEHAPVRFEGCPACHEPHGSANPRMLARHEVRLVCLECHANNPPPPSIPGPATAKVNNLGQVPPAFHNLLLPRFQNCTVCHVKIHGSYVDRVFER